MLTRRTSTELQNFGSILSFAAELEAGDLAFYEAAAANPARAEHQAMLAEFAADENKNEKTMLRVRRETVTEMILEPITDFSGEPFLTSREGVDGMTAEQILVKALELEEKAERFYRKAAERMKALSEVSRALNRIARQRSAHKERLMDRSGTGST